jgi:molybdopterin-guanine dinucleotide biosynthesis protein B
MGPMTTALPPILGIAAYSGTGKTTLLTRVIPLLREQGLNVALVKHAHHNFEPDQPGKDSYELRKAGAGQVLVASHRLWALFREDGVDEEPVLGNLVQHLDRRNLDLILVEGFKHESIPKIELHRPSMGLEPMYPTDDDIIAVASDGDLPQSTKLPVLDLNDVKSVAGFMARWVVTPVDE